MFSSVRKTNGSITSSYANLTDRLGKIPTMSRPPVSMKVLGSVKDFVGSDIAPAEATSKQDLVPDDNQEKSFFLTYGGSKKPTVEIMTPAEIQRERDDYEKRVFPPIFSYHNVVDKITLPNGIEVTVDQCGFHRSIQVTLPANAGDEAKRKFKEALETAQTYYGESYRLFGHNCVRGVVKVLNMLDETLKIPADTWRPWRLNNHLKNNLKVHYGMTDKNETLNIFKKAYLAKCHKEYFLFFRKHHVTSNNISSLEDLIKHAYGHSKIGTGGRTKATLIALEWIKEANGKLALGKEAPADFQTALEAYNAKLAKLPAENIMTYLSYSHAR